MGDSLFLGHDTEDSSFYIEPKIQKSFTCIDVMDGLSDKSYTTLGKCLDGVLRHSRAALDSENDPSLNSWQRLHPEQWDSNDVLNLIYYVAGECRGINISNLRGEQFQDLSGADLCSMTKENFIQRDDLHGELLYGCIQTLLYKSQFSPPEELLQVKKEEDYYSFLDLPKPVADLIDDDDCFDHKLNSDESLKFTMLGHSYDIDNTAVFDNIPPAVNDSGYDSTADFVDPDRTYSSYLYPHLDILPPINSCCMPMDLRTHDHDVTSLAPWSNMSYHTHPKTLKRQNATLKRSNSSSSSSDGEHDRPPAKKHPHSNKGNHLWEFIRHLLKNSEGMGKDRIIQWENREEGVFRIVNSKEVAELWGKQKNNKKMTYEKLSRALRWCRTYGFLGALPKDGKYPKKLCFRFGARARNWRD